MTQAGVRAAEWIHIVVFCFFVSLSWIRRLPARRRAKVTLIGVAGLGATLIATFLFLMDVFFGYLFYFMKVLKTPPF